MIPFPVDDFIWPEGIADKVIAKHGLDPDAVEASFFKREARVHRARDGRLRLFSRTPSDQYIIVVCEYQRRLVTIVTARQMTHSERRLHSRK